MNYLRKESFAAVSTTTTKFAVSESILKEKQAEKNEDIYERGTLFTEIVEKSQVKSFQ